MGETSDTVRLIIPLVPMVHLHVVVRVSLTCRFLFLLQCHFLRMFIPAASYQDQIRRGTPTGAGQATL
jgi:hypothetical protein